MKQDDRRLVVFGRCPEPGTVKTRLAPRLGARGAARLYARLLEHALDTATAYLPGGVELWLADPPGQDCALRLARHGCPLRVQRGTDLGARMHFALGSAPAHRDRVVLVGSDCPLIDHDVLGAAFSALRRHDAVFAPAQDGGYALVGVRRSHPRLFHEIPWSTAEVMPTTRARLIELGWRWLELTPVRDVDTPEDIDFFQSVGTHFSEIFQLETPDAMA